MRVFIIALSILGFVVSANVANAGPSTDDRDLLASFDPAVVADEATQETEDRIGLDKGKRRDVQRRLTGLGFDTKVSGRFDESTRAVITRWQAARGYPRTGFLNTLQHHALLTESVSAAHARVRSDDDRPARHSGGAGSAHYHRSGGGPGGLIDWRRGERTVRTQVTRQIVQAGTYRLNINMRFASIVPDRHSFKVVSGVLNGPFNFETEAARWKR